MNNNLGQMMKQAQEMQQKLQEMQQRMAATDITGKAGGGMVEITMTVKGDARRIKIDPQLINPNDKEMLEDLLVSAINDARTKAEAFIASETEKMMGGMNLPPGMKLPF
ncbi:MAG: YbaB/EbfC family nucleoid-associated protein [Alphaproteobacteria bacterium]|nr:YbaB/EbfC family nucleoid-associated protein [Alphaproteobacteria bacterium]